MERTINACLDRRTIDRGRRLEDASPLAGLCLCLVYGLCMGGVIGYLVRAWWG